MMKEFRLLLIYILISTTLAIAAGFDWKNTPRWDSYIETTNDIFSIGCFDHNNEIIYRFKDVTIERTNMPSFETFQPLIYAQGEQSETYNETHYAEELDIILDSNKKDHSEVYYRYGKIPYPVKIVDPPLDVCRTKENNVAVGFRLASHFYSITNIETNADLKFTYSIDNRDLHLIPLDVPLVHIKLPEHRKEEIKVFVDEMKKKIDYD